MQTILRRLGLSNHKFSPLSEEATQIPLLPQFKAIAVGIEAYRVAPRVDGNGAVFA